MPPRRRYVAGSSAGLGRLRVQQQRQGSQVEGSLCSWPFGNIMFGWPRAGALTYGSDMARFVVHHQAWVGMAGPDPSQT